MSQPKVSNLHYSRKRRELDISFSDGTSGALSAEMLRIWSPSAEVRGHGVGQETLQTGKSDVGLVEIKPVGHYAVQLIFSDGHDSGLFTWAYLRELIDTREQRWKSYLAALKAAGKSRDSDVQVLHFEP
ncbi:conserved hypothetical protein [Luminiphilus syltensis NOR5-1B]|uniref:Gamma-butyrobetaine hydroxylase-like N-terminal domain-containing protein n=1 Tax=Luminiphilus syltensis NOR5-1B TaxID=565045 RepID=B8KUS5_9GAMM|nr:DUF971 domain-containing protein [Luminiphilus syltensis]EED36561.1 conserved hypothetical protein [Luminiphilus syltensis NOR5-1B]